jgi:hypothetical protein
MGDAGRFVRLFAFLPQEERGSPGGTLVLLLLYSGFIKLYYSYLGCFKIITYLEEHMSYSPKLVTPSNP